MADAVARLQAARNAPGTPHPEDASPSVRIPQSISIKRRKETDGDTTGKQSAKLRRQPPPRRRKATDKQLPGKLEDLVIESELFKKLVEQESRIDAVISRKRVEAFDASKRPLRTKKTVRVFLSTRGLNQEEGASEPPGWVFRLEGRLIEEKDAGKAARRKFNTFFRRIFVELDSPLFSDKERYVEMTRDSNIGDCDGFEIKRRGSDPLRCKLVMVLDNQPEVYKLSPRLARLLGMQTATRTTVTLALWEYIKMHKLLDRNDRTTVNGDDSLEQLFQRRSFQFTTIPDLIAPHLLPLDPIEIDYIINPDNNGEPDACYDIEVEAEDASDKARAQQFLQSPSDVRELAELDNKIGDLIDQIREGKVRRDFMLSFANDPVNFIQKWIVSQHNDLKTMNDLSVNPEEERHAEYYQKQWVEEAVWKYLSEKTNERRRQLELHLADLKA